MAYPIAGMVVRHYKGGRYTIIAVADSHEHNGDQFVIYVSHTNGRTFCRPLASNDEGVDAWDDVVTWPDGQTRQRFIPDDHNASTLEYLFKEKT